MLQRHEVPVELAVYMHGVHSRGASTVRLGRRVTECLASFSSQTPSWAHRQATRHYWACRRRTPTAIDSFAAGIWARRVVQRLSALPAAGRCATLRRGNMQSRPLCDSGHGADGRMLGCNMKGNLDMDVCLPV